MPTTITLDRVEYTLQKLDNGNIRVTHAGGQRHPMHAAGTGGIHVFEVHPCQPRWYGYWNDLLAPDQRGPTGPGRDGAKPWWSSKSWKRGRGEAAQGRSGAAAQSKKT